MRLKDPTETDVERLLLLSRVCVISPLEDQMLRQHGYRDKPTIDDSGELDIEGRYRTVGIQIAKQPFLPDNGSV